MTVAELVKLETPKLGPEVAAQMNGSCYFCGGAIVAGRDYIRKAGRHWGHSLCATGYVRTIEEHGEEDVDETPADPWPANIVIQREKIDDDRNGGYRYVVLDGTRSTDFRNVAAYRLIATRGERGDA